MGPTEDDQRARREKMVEHDLRRRGVSDTRVLHAMRSVKRQRFLPQNLADRAYDDSALPIEGRQTISQPFIVALMAEAAELEPTSRVLEVGAGSGYGAAVLGLVAGDVWTVERDERLAETARERLGELGYDNVHVVYGDGSRGLAEQAPFDAVIVTAAAREVPEPLIDQLVDGGRLIVPVGPRDTVQRLRRIRRRGGETVEEDLGAVRFVPLIAEVGE